MSLVNRFAPIVPTDEMRNTGAYESTISHRYYLPVERVANKLSAALSTTVQP